MNWWIILIIIACTTILILLIALILLIKKNKQKKILKITKDINTLYKYLKLKKINTKELPVSIEKIKEDIYYSDKVILGKYEDLNKISGQNILLKTEYSDAKKLFLRYKIKDINLIKSSDFIPLNQIDLLISRNNLYFIDSFELQIIPLVNVKSITFFWEKNNYIKNKQKYIGIEINFQNKRLFFLFNKYEEAISFAVHVISL
ncbi:MULTISPECIES: hypothetical protein [unclassified Spiroplasma]|uniref:hypothetical protein n=1 Tax=unclassified Spiroplasma TaxID=2637901 RepID=UPI001E196CAF|nr:hypothetical protein [Spiroplasma ixodetis]MBP1527460.1 hypothetical protein [Spiroplasma ixodetis]MBP1528592.1 hypothetical protein [Spiroplasma ixodetis]